MWLFICLSDIITTYELCGQNPEGNQDIKKLLWFMHSARTIIEAGKTSRHTDKGVVDFFSSCQ